MAGLTRSRRRASSARRFDGPRREGEPVEVREGLRARAARRRLGQGGGGRGARQRGAATTTAGAPARARGVSAAPLAQQLAWSSGTAPWLGDARAKAAPRGSRKATRRHGQPRRLEAREAPRRARSRPARCRRRPSRPRRRGRRARGTRPRASPDFGLRGPARGADPRPWCVVSIAAAEAAAARGRGDATPRAARGLLSDATAAFAPSSLAAANRGPGPRCPRRSGAGVFACLSVCLTAAFEAVARAARPWVSARVGACASGPLAQRAV